MRDARRLAWTKGLGCKLWGKGLRVFWKRIENLGFRVWGLGLRVVGKRIEDLGFRSSGLPDAQLT